MLKRKRSKPAVSRILVVLVALFPGMALGGTLTGGATLPEQIVQEATAIQAKIEGAERLVTQIQQYENMVQNMVNLPQQVINQVMQPIDQMYGLASQAENLGTNAQNIAQQFQSMNPSFNPQLTAQYTQNYESINTGLQNAINTALQAANLNPNNFATQAQAQQAIAQAMQNPNSRNAILNASVAIGQATTSDLNQLLATVTAENNAEMDWKANKLNTQVQQTGEIAETMSQWVGGTIQTPPLSGNPIDALNP